MKLKEQWELLAKELDFRFDEGIDALVHSPHLEKIIREEFPGKIQDFAKLSSMINSPFLRGMIAKVFMGMMAGTYRGFEFLIYPGTASSSGSGSRTYFVNTALFFKNPYHLGMQITAAAFFTPLGKKLFPGSYVRLTGSRLDPLVAIKGKNKEQIRTMLSYRRLQAQLIELFSFSTDFKIADHGIRFREPGQIVPAERLIELMDRMATAAETFY